MPKPGYLTPSSFDKLMVNNRKGDGPGDTAMSVINQLVLDWLGVYKEDVDAPALNHGKMLEDEARLVYVEQTGKDAYKPENFMVSQDLDFVGGYIDGLIPAENQGIEIKCPFNPVNHLEFVANCKKYQYQIQGYMWIYRLESIDFVSYHPEFVNENKELLILNIPRNDEMIASLQERCSLAHQLAAEKYYQFIGETNG